ncbi:uncharacterized protein AKAW2_80242A [Aspergillus luchuensis]|uniref:FAD binding oxidoreductase n=1 Tax=Aspergillus kawachii TaxID=1069201 RepID=A0A146F917_ASPKA|nr:uncharacterized protein AKAW2_80242A [Aspergillus luchuensis]BCS04441.1 hypothetical protein AKAW2_80242A [Aspergillus luchuensis]GAT22242.1 FAD binding oxidoreductase [Aspergillus luchuensis]
MRGTMKGCVFNLPIREEFVQRLLESYKDLTERVPDSARSVLQFDLFDPTVVATKASNTDMAFHSRGYHFNAAAEVFWHSTEHDVRCRQWARDIAAIFKAELKRDEKASNKSDPDPVMMLVKDILSARPFCIPSWTLA